MGTYPDEAKAPSEALDDWNEVVLSIGPWRERSANRAIRILRDYVGTGESVERVRKVLGYLSTEDFLEGVIGNHETDALREFCSRKLRKHNAGGTLRDSEKPAVFRRPGGSYE